VKINPKKPDASFVFAAASAAIEFPEITLAINNASKVKATPVRMIASLSRSAL
jgi:hypothetical protein